MAEPVKDAWVERVLGMSLGSTGAAAGVSLKDAVVGWRTASEAVDKQIAALQRALKATDDDELHEIAEYGLNAVTGNFRVPLMAALAGAERGDQRDLAKLAALIPGFRAHLQSDLRIEVCDENDFNTPVSIRATLLPALDQLARAAKA